MSTATFNVDTWVIVAVVIISIIPMGFIKMYSDRIGTKLDQLMNILSPLPMAIDSLSSRITNLENKVHTLMERVGIIEGQIND